MAAKGQDDTLLYEVAELYYEHGMTQADLGRRLGLTTMNVSRLLKAARQKGIVKITVERRVPRASEYETALIKKFGLKHAIVIDTSEDGHLELVPVATAQHIQLLLQPNMVVGLGVGPTLARVVANLHPQRLPSLTVVQLSGGYHEAGDAYSHDLVRNLTEVLGARGLYFHAPMMFSDESTKDLVLEKVIDTSLAENWARCSMAIVAVNPIRSEAMTVESGFITRKEQQELVERGAVGVLLGHFFNAKGEFIDHDVNRRVASIPLALLGKVENVVAVNRYENRHLALLGALRTGLLDTVITDVISAKYVCGDSNASPGVAA